VREKWITFELCKNIYEMVGILSIPTRVVVVYNILLFMPTYYLFIKLIYLMNALFNLGNGALLVPLVSY